MKEERHAPLSELKRTAERFAYLGSADKIITALRNEYGSDRKMPSLDYIERLLVDRAAPPRSMHHASRRRFSEVAR